MKKYFICSMLFLCGMAQQALAQGYYLYKNGQKQQIVRANDVDSLVFFKEPPPPVNL